MRLYDIILALGKSLDGLDDIPINNLSLDSRQIQSGDVFFALPGGNVDGRDFIAQAIAKGAVAIIAEAGVSLAKPVDIPLIEVAHLPSYLASIAQLAYPHPSIQHLIGVTGTNGKTSTCHYLAQGFSALGKKVAIISTVGSGIWPKLTSQNCTTPDIFSVYRYLYQFAQTGIQTVIIEVSSHALVQGRVAGIAFTGAVFTNLSHEHLDYHGDMSSYAQAKAQLFATPHLHYAVLNADDPWSETMRMALPAGCKHYDYQLSSGHHASQKQALCYQHIVAKDHKTTAELCKHPQYASVELNVMGDFNYANTLAASLAIMATGYSLEQVSRITPYYRPVCGRLELVHNHPRVFIDYAHTPDALTNVLKVLHREHRNRLCVLFGCGGHRDYANRPKMLAVAQQYADIIVVTSDNSRDEDPKAIIADILSEMQSESPITTPKIHIEPDRQQGIEWVLSAAQQNDLILLAGKGHETTLVTHGKAHHFDEREIIKDFYKENPHAVTG